MDFSSGRLQVACRWSKNQGNSEDIVKTTLRQRHGSVSKPCTTKNVCIGIDPYPHDTITYVHSLADEAEKQSAYLFMNPSSSQLKMHHFGSRKNTRTSCGAMPHATTEPRPTPALRQQNQWLNSGNNTSAVIGQFVFLGAMDRLVICSLGQLFNLDPCKRLDTTGQPCPCKRSAAAKLRSFTGSATVKAALACDVWELTAKSPLMSPGLVYPVYQIFFPERPQHFVG